MLIRGSEVNEKGKVGICVFMGVIKSINLCNVIAI